MKEPRVLALYQKAIDEWNEGKSHEQQIIRFALLPADLTIEGGELTPTLKVKRRIIDRKYKALIDELYDERRTERPARGPKARLDRGAWSAYAE